MRRRRSPATNEKITAGIEDADTKKERSALNAASTGSQLLDY